MFILPTLAIVFFLIGYPQFPRISLTSWDLPWQKLIIWSNQGASPALTGRRWVKWQAFQMANAMAVHLAVGLEGPGWPLKKKWEEVGDLMKSGTFKNGLRNFDQLSIPIGSMYGIYSNIYHQYTPNVSIYTIEPLEFGSVFEILVYVAAGWCLATSRCGWGCDEKKQPWHCFLCQIPWEIWLDSFGFDSAISIHVQSISIHVPSIFHPFSGSCGRLSGDNLGGRHRPESQRVPTQAVQNNTDSWRMQDHAEPWLPIAQCYVYILWYR